MFKFKSIKIVLCLGVSSFACMSCASTGSDRNTHSNAHPHDQKLVCPAPGTWVDCMPSIGAEKYYCREDVKKWVAENCEDVNYAY